MAEEKRRYFNIAACTIAKIELTTCRSSNSGSDNVLLTPINRHSHKRLEKNDKCVMLIVDDGSGLQYH